MPSAAPLTFIPPQLDAKVLASARLLLPLWLRRAGITAVEVEGIERLQQCLEQFQTGQSRLLLAFRHPSVDDPAVLAQLLWNELARAGRPAPQPGPAGRPGRHRFRPRPHAQFLYDRGIPLWAGEPIGWLLCHLGGCSIQRSKLDLPALRTARALLLDGPYPFAVAPEGATNGHNEVISPLEPGVAQLALWTADDLERAGRSETTQLLPIGLQYSFTAPVWPAIEALLRQLEADGGLPPSADASLDPQRLYGRLLRLAELILSQMERFYRDAYHQPLPRPPPPVPPPVPMPIPIPIPMTRSRSAWPACWRRHCGWWSNRWPWSPMAMSMPAAGGWSRPAGIASIRPAAPVAAAEPTARRAAPHPPAPWSGGWPTGWRRKPSAASGTCASSRRLRR